MSSSEKLLKNKSKVNYGTAESHPFGLPDSSTSTEIDTSSVCPIRSHQGSVNDSFYREPSLDADTRSWRSGMDSLSDAGSLSEIHQALDKSEQFAGLDEASVLQAVVFAEDAFQYRSINHKVEPVYLNVYRVYQSTPVVICRLTVIFVLHMLAFFEPPSSLTWTSDLRSNEQRVDVPCWLTQSIELICLVFLMLDNMLRMYLTGLHYFIRHKWDVCAVIILCLSFVDWLVSFGFNCGEFVRIRRILRPFFIMQNSSLMKKIVNCLRRTVPEVASVLLLLALHLYIFALFGMLLFPQYEKSANGTIPFYKINNRSDLSRQSNFTTPFSGDPWRNLTNNSQPMADIYPASEEEGGKYFRTFLQALISLLVLLTTANNPDVTISAYNNNRLASLFFILYLVIGLYCFMNVLLAVIYNQFRGYFQSAMQSSLLRRRLGVRAAFEVLRRKKCTYNSRFDIPGSNIGVGVGGYVISDLIRKASLPDHVKSIFFKRLQGKEELMFSPTQFQELFYILDTRVIHKQKPAVRWYNNPKLRLIQRVFIHRYFVYFGMFISLVNLIIITVQLAMKHDMSVQEDDSFLRIVNFSFVTYYFLEQVIKVWALGMRRYVSDLSNVFDAIVTLALIIGEIFSAAKYGFDNKELEQSDNIKTWNIIRMINILIMVRMFKIIPHIKSMSIVATVLIDLVKNMKAFAGVLVVIFYAFAMVGMELFHGAIEYEPSYANKTFSCGTYEQLEYWANNFDDFFASLVVLWDVMVVNNWMVFLEVFRRKTSPWSYLFFIAWWLTSVVMILNLFTALIMENFIMKWDRRNQVNQAATESITHYEDITVSVQLNSVHQMFQHSLQEPADNELLVLLSKHHYLQLERA